MFVGDGGKKFYNTIFNSILKTVKNYKYYKQLQYFNE